MQLVHLFLHVSDLQVLRLHHVRRYVRKSHEYVIDGDVIVDDVIDGDVIDDDVIVGLL